MALIRNKEADQTAQDAVVLDLGDLRREADRLRKRAEAEAEQIREEARAEARRLTEGAEQRGYEAGYEKGHAEGREAGYQKGHAEALRQAESSLNQLQEAWVNAAKQWDAERREMVQEARQSLLRLAVRMAEKIVRRVPMLEPSVVQAQVEAAIEQVARPCDVKVWIHPEDRPLVKQALPRAVGQLSQSEHISLREDARMERGGCVVDYGTGRIDATLQTQIDRLVEALLPGEGGEAGEEEQPPGGQEGQAEAEKHEGHEDTKSTRGEGTQGDGRDPDGEERGGARDEARNPDEEANPDDQAPVTQTRAGESGKGGA